MTHECGAFAPHRRRRRHAHLPWVAKHSLGLCLTFTDMGRRRRFVMQVLHEALRAYRRITVRLINYRADGTPFVNDLTVLPLLDEQTGTKVTHFLGITCERPLPKPLASSAMSLAPAIAAPEAMHVVSVSETGDDMNAAAAGDDEMSASDTPSAIVRPSVSSATSALRSADGIVPSGGGGSSSSMSETAPYVPTKLLEALQVRARAPAPPFRTLILSFRSLDRWVTLSHRSNSCRSRILPLPPPSAARHAPPAAGHGAAQALQDDPRQRGLVSAVRLPR